MATSPAKATAEVTLIDSIQAMSRATVALTTRSLAQMAEEATLAQYRALVVLVSQGPRRVRDLAAELNVAASTASRLCNRLVGKGLVRRSRHEPDRRAVWVSLTEAGATFIGEAMRLRREAIRDCLASMDLDAVSVPEVAGGLNAFVAATGEPSEAEWWRRWRALSPQAAPHPDAADNLDPDRAPDAATWSSDLWMTPEPR